MRLPRPSFWVGVESTPTGGAIELGKTGRLAMPGPFGLRPMSSRIRASGSSSDFCGLFLSKVASGS